MKSEPRETWKSGGRVRAPGTLGMQSTEHVMQQVGPTTQSLQKRLQKRPAVYAHISFLAMSVAAFAAVPSA